MPLRILLADDSMTAQKMGKDILTGAGYEVTTVSNGAAAAKKLADKPDVYILDIFMPGYSGIELCEKIRAATDTAKAPVILTVGKMEPYNQVDVQRVKADGVIIKPFEASDLLAAVKKFVEAANPAPPPTPAYEKTMIFTPPQIEEFKDQSYNEWKSETAEPEELPAPPPPLRITQEMAAAPAFMMDADATVEIPPAPRPANDFDDTVTYSAPIVAPQSAAAAAAASGPAMDFGMDFPAVAPVAEVAPAPTMDFGMPATAVAMDFGMPAVEPVPEPPPASTSDHHEVEFNSAPKAGPVKVVTESGLESDDGNAEISIKQDPSLVTDPTEIATEFVTKFGVDGEVDLGPGEKGFAESRPETPVGAAPAEDDFEARVAAAMSGFGEQAAPVEGSPVEEVVTVAPVEEVSPVPAVEDTQQVEAVDESKQPPAGMADASLVEQMQAAFADLPVETAPVEPEPEPVVEAAPAPIVADVAPMSPPGQDMELATALAAAVGAEPPPPAVPSVAAAAASAVSSAGMDPNTAATVVSKVLERMLPAIMQEVAKELEAAKKS